MMFEGLISLLSCACIVSGTLGANIGIWESILSENDTKSWAQLHASAVEDNSTNTAPIESFTICLRFNVRVFPNLNSFISFGTGDDMESEEDMPVRFYLGYRQDGDLTDMKCIYFGLLSVLLPFCAFF